MAGEKENVPFRNEMAFREWWNRRCDAPLDSLAEIESMYSQMWCIFQPYAEERAWDMTELSLQLGSLTGQLIPLIASWESSRAQVFLIHAAKMALRLIHEGSEGQRSALAECEELNLLFGGVAGMEENLAVPLARQAWAAAQSLRVV